MPPIYLDNHATTAVDPRVLEAMVPYFLEHYGNAGSTSHEYGWKAKEAVEAAREQIAQAIGASASEIVFTSGATESNNLALRGVLQRLPDKPRRAISLATEHRAVLDPLRRLARLGHHVTLIPVHGHESADCSQPDFDQLRDAIQSGADIVSIMLANNEIGTIIDLARVRPICQEGTALLHCDATQAVGKIPVDVNALGVDLMSFSAHKLYGPKGIGALYVRQQARRARIAPQIDGGGQEGGLRSGTLPVPLIVGFAKAVHICVAEMASEMSRLSQLRERLFQSLQQRIPDIRLNGPALNSTERSPADAAPPTQLARLPHNLNVQFPLVDGETLMINTPEVALSSGSACSATNPEPSHVLRAIGLSDDEVRSSLRFGLGRWTTEEQVDQAAEAIAASTHRLRSLH